MHHLYTDTYMPSHRFKYALMPTSERNVMQEFFADITSTSSACGAPVPGGYGRRRAQVGVGRVHGPVASAGAEQGKETNENKKRRETRKGGGRHGFKDSHCPNLFVATGIYLIKRLF
ncbi:hypothetical protein B296_00022527 [Ensete ventricosum]|uniref:Uncharacterized protein n=1 Tax=Ensete ventricosum TaxID=4639 RepID=A0A427ANQ9_ENSVE|nr:hypothetical protein B296_00022527 [Ensete ventricosum]